MSAGTPLAPLTALMRRESRGARGRLVFMTACLAIGVAAVTGVAALVSAVEGAVRRDARALLAADVVVESRRPIPEEVEALVAPGAGAVSRAAQVTELGAMVRRDGDAGADGILLAELKAATAGYPLYGELVTSPAGLRPGALAEDESIAAPELLAQLGIGVGDTILVGGQSFRIAAELVDEPDRVDFAMTLGPRLFLSPAGLERTALVGFGSRVKHRRLVALESERPEAAARAFIAGIREASDQAAYLTYKSFTRPSPGLTRALDNVGSYLGLVALLSLLLGGIGVAQVVRAWLGSRAPAIATLRSLGMRPREVFLAYFGHVLGLAVIGCAVGIAAGLAAPYLVRAFAPELMESGVGGLQWGAAARGLVLGLGTAAVFSLPPLTAVWRVSPARVLRAEAAPLPAPSAVRLGTGAALVFGVFAFAWLQARDPLVAAAFTAGLGVLVGLLAGAARLVSRLAGSVPRGALTPTARHGLAALARPGAGVAGAAVALGLGTLVVVALGLVGSRLNTELINGAPPDAPTVFLVDVQPGQWDGVRAIMDDVGATNVDSTPVVMARLAGLRGTPIADLLEERRGGRGRGRGRWQLTREQRLTWADELPGGNTLVEGSLWSDPEADEISVEVEFAKSLGVGVGDTVAFDVQGVTMEFLVTSLREVDWASFRINFFLLVEPGVMDGAPGWRLAAAKLPAGRERGLQARVVEAFPNVSVLRIRPLLERVAATLHRIALAVRLLGGFTILTGIAILAGAVAASSMRRGGEAALLKALGLTRRGVALLFSVEFGLLGLMAGLLGGLGALLLSWVFLSIGLDMEGVPNLAAVPAAGLATAALAILAGLASSARALGSSPMAALRR